MELMAIEAAIEHLRRGGMIIVVDDEDRENEGDLTIAAQVVTPEAINFMISHGRGLVCMPCDGARLDELEIGSMVAENTAEHETAFAVSIDHREAGSGISAHDRAFTIRQVMSSAAKPVHFARPGHVFPLRARPGGVLERAGHTEASVDLARLAGFAPCAVICEILDVEGAPARMPYLVEFGVEHEIPLVSIESLIEHRLQREPIRESEYEVLRALE